MKWKSDQLQSVVFLRPEAPLSAVDVWQRVFDTTPDSFQRQPTNPTVSNAWGTKDGLQLNIISQIGRVDFTFLPGPLETTENFPQIENFPAALAKLSGYAAQFAKGLAVPRAAIVANLSQSAKLEDASSIIRKLTGVEFPQKALDPIYQFNVRRQLQTFPDVQVNRLCTWGAGENQLVTVSPQSGTSPIVVVSRSFVTLKIDVNTLANFELSEGRAERLFSEIVEIVCDVANRGLEAFK